MITFKQVLCPIDLSDASKRPLAYAAAVAHWYKARLSVLHVVPTFDPIPVHPGALEAPVRIVYPMSREDVLGAVRRVTEEAGIDAADVDVIAEAGEGAATIVDQAVARGTDLLVMGTHGRTGIDRLLLGSVTEQVLHEAPCPVLTVPPHAPETVPDDLTFKRVLCAVDFSPASMQALGFAVELAQQARGRVTILHVIEWLAEHEPRTYAHFNVPEYRRYLKDEAHERLRALVAEQPRLRGVEDMVGTGRAYREILGLAAEQHADLIVMGAQGRGGVGLALFGSTTQQVVRAAECPVLTVRAAGAARP